MNLLLTFFVFPEPNKCMKTFETFKKGDKILVIEINPDLFTISSREVYFGEWDYYKKYFTVQDKEKEVKLSISDNQTCIHRISSTLLSDVYYFSDIESLEGFLKKLDDKTVRFRNGIMEALKDSWDRQEES